jgi:hypothetical protein
MSLNFWQQKPEASWQAYWDSLNAPHRTAIVEALKTLPAFDSLLEVGAGPGVNLWRILEAFPDVDLTGLDVSQAAVDDGHRRFVEATQQGTFPGKGRVALCAGVLPEALEALDPVDAVLSCYTLAYVPPADIQVTMMKLLELAQRAIVIAEPMVIPGFPTGRIPSKVQEFRYDYLQCFQAVPGWRVTSMKPLTVDRMNRLLVAERVTPL